MKTKIVVALMAVACAGLAIALFVTKNKSDEQRKADQASIKDLTQQVVSVTQTNAEIKDVNLELNRELTNNQAQLAALSNNLAAAAATLAESSTALSNAQEKITGLNTHIADLEQQNKTLDQHATELSGTIAQLDSQIAETRARLAASETNNAYLELELQKQMAAKAGIEHKFNDLDSLRQQVKKIKNDMYVARRLQLMKNSTSGKKGAELLTTHEPPPAGPQSGAGYGLNVEVGSDGSVRVIPPMAPTNSAAH